MMWSRLSHDPLGFLWQAVQTRGVRLTFYLLLTEALFPSSRLILLAVLLVTLAVMWTRSYSRYGSRNIVYLAGALCLLLVGYGLAWMDVTKVEELRLAKSPWGKGIKLVNDGSYVGEGQGFRGPIRVRVDVDKHRVTGIRLLEYPDLISVKDNEIARLKQQVLTAGMLERPAELPMLRGAGQTMTGYFNAIESALTKGIPDYPQYGTFAGIYVSSVIGQAPNRVTLNALAILFAVFVVFEYALQSMLTPGTGRSINCYNCASCVGACPVKEVEGIPMPMGLILLTRLGDYERVKELSKYCVGCGRCAIKCPIGNSGPLVISAAFQAARKQEAERQTLKQGDEA